jgi:hypothetical protein
VVDIGTSRGYAFDLRAVTLGQLTLGSGEFVDAQVLGHRRAVRGAEQQMRAGRQVSSSAAATIASSAAPRAPTSIPAPAATRRKAIGLALPAAWNLAYGVLKVSSPMPASNATNDPSRMSRRDRAHGRPVVSMKRLSATVAVNATMAMTTSMPM